MKKIYLYLSGAILILLGVFGCAKVDVNAPKTTGKKPDPVTQYTVTSMYGAAKIKFRMPEAEDLLYVKAAYKLSSGKSYVAKSSLYKDYLVVEGFEKEGSYEVTLYAVAKGEVESDPTDITVDVLTPPYILARNSVAVEPTFGGVFTKLINEVEADFSVYLLDKNEKGEWTDKYIHYTNSAQPNFAVRGYDTIPREFGVFVKDQWGNISDTLITTIQPMFEEPIPTAGWKKYLLPGDQTDPHPSYPTWVFEGMWDGTHNDTRFFHTAPVLPLWPSTFTIDLGLTAILSRTRIYPHSGLRFASNSLKTFEIYGSNDPSLDGSWDGWTKLGLFEVIKPSGAPLGTVTAEDTQAALAGFDFEFPSGIPPYRYIRFQVLSVWGGTQSISIDELMLWGAIQH